MFHLCGTIEYPLNFTDEKYRVHLKADENLIRICNISFNDSALPTYWKTAIIVPIYKLGKRTDVKNGVFPFAVNSFCGQK